jgi:nucleoside-diphosphate-sugar epimerase
VILFNSIYLLQKVIELKQISLFGATGFIGSSFVDNFNGSVDQVSKHSPDPIYPNILYAIGTTDNYNIFDDPTLDIETNIIKLIEDLVLLKNKFGTFTINYVSSWFVYGDSLPLPFTSDHNCNPKGFYSISKYAAEKFLISFCETYKINYRILRLSNIYGKNDTGISAKKNALQYLINDIKTNKTIELYDGGDFIRDYLDVRDCVSAINLVISKGKMNHTYNIGSGIPVKFIDLMVRAKEVFKSSSELINVPIPEFHQLVQVKNSYLDISDLLELGFCIKHNIFDEISNL